MKNGTNQTAMQELLQHFIDAWSSPGDCWNPGKVIDKIEIMIEKEKQQIIEAYLTGADYTNDEEVILANEYYNETYN